VAEARRLFYLVDRGDAPLDAAIAVARSERAALAVRLMVDETWTYVTGYPTGAGALLAGPTGAAVLARAVRATLRRLDERLRRSAAAEVGWSVAEFDRGELAAATHEDLLMLASPRLLARLSAPAGPVVLAGPGRGADAAVVAFCAEGEATSIGLARNVAAATRRRFALLHVGTAPPPEREALWVQKVAEVPLDVVAWLRATRPASLVLPPGAVRRVIVTSRRD